MKILLVGGDGFVGKNISEKFSDKYEIVSPSKDGADFSVTRSAADYFDAHDFDVVIDCGDTENRLARFKNLQYFCTLKGIAKLLVVSTVYPEQYGKSLVGATEEDFENDASSAGAIEYLIARLTKKDKIGTVLRLFAPYGKYCDVGENKTMELIARGVTGKKTAVVEREAEFSAVFIDDVMKAIGAYLAGGLPKGVYNVAADKTLTYTSVARTAKRLAAKDFRELEIEKKSEADALIVTANTEKLTLALPKLRFTAHSAALKSVYEHLCAHKSQARPKKR